MKFTITALIDDETRKQLRGVLDGMIRSISREALTEQVRYEIREKLNAAQNAMVKNDWSWRNNIFTIMKEMMLAEVKTQWPAIGAMINDAANKFVEEAVLKKLANKTVWEAAQQKDFIREIVRDEIKNSFKQVFGEKI